MKPSVYIETTIPSYLTAWPSRDLIRAANQQATREWWEHRARYELFVSTLVILECQRGDPTAAADRLAALDGIPLLEETDEALALTDALLREVRIPPRAASDATHIAAAAIHGMDYLLTWNCTHMANAMLRPTIEAVCRAFGCEPPIICTPLELMPLGEET